MATLTDEMGYSVAQNQATIQGSIYLGGNNSNFIFSSEMKNSPISSQIALEIWAFGYSTQEIMAPVKYFMRAWDTGTVDFVYWFSVNSINTTPSETFPQFTGTLTGICVVHKI